MDLAATDILRTRELGVPRYNEFRRLLHLDAADDVRRPDRQPGVGAARCERVYDGDIEQRRPDGRACSPSGCRAGFAFSDTAFRIFILMASRRLNSDRFFTDGLHARRSTRPTGMDWIDDNDMATVLLRHYPELAPAMRGLDNAFVPWNAATA